MIWPNICVDNFFDNPENIIQFSNSLQYFPNLKSPGVQSKPLHEINNNFFSYVNLKILSILYPNNYLDLHFNALSYFVKVPPNLEGDGWVHHDGEIFQMTSIVYLSKNINAGTSIYKLKKEWERHDNNKVKHKHFENIHNNIINKKINDYRDLNNSFYEKTIEYKAIYNRLISFDSSSFHAAEPYKNKNSNEERLTLISFFKNICYAEDKMLRYPLTELKRNQ